MRSARRADPADAAIAEMGRSCLLMRSRLISRIVTSLYDEELRPFGIGSAQLVLLVVIFRLQPASRAEIGRFHHQDRSTLTRNLRIILAEGWAEETHHEGGGRSKRIVLTASGKDLLYRAWPAWQAGQARAKKLLGKAGADAVMTIGDGILESPPDG